MGFFDSGGWVHGALSNQLDRAEKELSTGRNTWNEFGNNIKQNFLFPAGDAWNRFGGWATDNLYGNVFGYNPAETLFSQDGYTPGWMRGMQQAGEAAWQPGREITQTANRGFQGGGWTPQYQQGFDYLNYMMGGANPLVNAGVSGGLDLLQSRGMDPMTAIYQDLAIKAAAGDTSTGAEQRMAQLGMQNIEGGGWTPQSGAMSDVGMQILQQNPLMSPEQAMSFAADTAGAKSRQAAQAQMARSLARGGGPGSVVASGLQEEGMADYYDQANRLQADSVQNALNQQQQLGLGQWGQAGGLLSGAGQLAAQRLGQGMDMVGSAHDRDLQRQGMYFGQGQQAGQQANDRMTLGANLMGQTGQLQSGLMGLYNQMMGNQNQYALGLGGLGMQGSSNLGNLYQGFAGNELGAGQLSAQRGNMLQNAYLQQMNQQQNFLNQQQAAFQQNYLSPMFQLMDPSKMGISAGLNAVTGGVPVASGGNAGIGGQLLNTAVGAAASAAVPGR
jgi:hypothetical protein